MIADFILAIFVLQFALCERVLATENGKLV